MRRNRFDRTVDWHVFSRGTRRLTLFHDADDHRMFLYLLKEAIELAGCTLWAFALMTNHYHLVLSATSDQLTSCMHHLNRLYSRYHNSKYHLKGHTFEGPFHAYPQKSVMLLLRTIAYVLLNPVTGGLVRRPEDYPWTSYRSYAGLPGSALQVNPNELFSRVSRDLRSAYRVFWRLFDLEARRLKSKPQGEPTAKEIQRIQFEWLLEEAKEAAGGGELSRDALEKVLYRADLCGIPPRVMSESLGDRSARSLQCFLSRIRRRVRSTPGLPREYDLP